MPDPIQIVLAQLNPLLGDMQGNCQMIIQAAKEAREKHAADLMICPEFALTGYPLEDLLLRSDCQEKINTTLAQLCEQIHDITVIVGHPSKRADKRYNSASIIQQGKIKQTYHKQHLPNYGVFDEKRYFTPGESVCLFELKGTCFGIVICEDLWKSGPLTQNVNAGAQVIISLNASPFYRDKIAHREATLKARQLEEGLCPILYVNMVGGQDELLFDGSSMVLNAEGKTVAHAPCFSEHLLPVTLTDHDIKGPIHPLPSSIEQIYHALILGTRDYLRKNNFTDVLIGLSGGIDSAITAVIATHALGAEHVHCVAMPSRYTSQISLDDAYELAKNLNVRCDTISIEPAFEAFLSSLAPHFKGLPADVAEENCQARCRGVILMALSNKFGKLVLTTGNKSEFAVGYATLYGDMCGGFAVLKDLMKMKVYELAAFINRKDNLIPARTITRPPSAELTHGQADQDTLPPYKILDEIIRLHVEEDCSASDIIAQGFESEVVHHVLTLIAQNEYKRRQAAPGIRLSKRAFGRDWRYPITSHYQH